MEFKVLPNRKGLYFVLLFLPLFTFVVFLILIIYTDLLIFKILLVINAMDWLLPWRLWFEPRYAGIIHFEENLISINTEKSVVMYLSDISRIEIDYSGLRGDIHWMGGGWSFESGIASCIIFDKNNTRYPVKFMVESTAGEMFLQEYTQYLDAHTVEYVIQIKDEISENVSDIDLPYRG